MMLRFRTALIAVVAVLCAASLLPPPAPAAGATTTITSRSGQKILVDGQLTSFRGFNYIPAPIGTGPFMPVYGAASTTTCRNDAAMMSNAGVNLIRIWWSDVDTASNALVRRCLDEMQAFGIGVAVTLQVGDNLHPVLEAGDKEAFVTAAWDRWRVAIDALRDHPAMRFWLLGNELELALNATGRATFFGSGSTPGALEELAARAKAQDPDHLVGSTISAQFCLGVMDSLSPHHAVAPSLDMWAINFYWSPLSEWLNGWECLPDGAYSGGYDFLSSYEADPRPVLITEFGTDRFACRNSSPLPTNANVVLCGIASSEDSGSQSQYLQTYLDEVNAHLTTSAVPGPLSGALAFAYSDSWSKEIFLPFTTHDTVGNPREATPSRFPDGVRNIEWWGVTHAQPPGVLTRRVAAPSFDVLAELWTGVARPTLSTIVTTVSLGCQVNVQFTTNEPTIAVINASPQNRVHDGAGHVLSESPTFVEVFNGSSGSPSTTHSIDVTLASQVPLEPWFLAVRAAAPDGRQANSDLLEVECL